MASMLEVMREYKHLAAKKRAEGVLPPSLEERLVELEGVVKANRKPGAPEVKAAPGGATDAKKSKPPELSSGAANGSSAARVARIKAPSGALREVAPPPEPAPKAIDLAPAQDVSRAAVIERVSPIDRLDAKLPPSLPKRAKVTAAGTGGLVAIALGVMMMGGLPLQRAYTHVLPALIAICGGAWFGLYPALFFWRERVADRGDAHINEPHFEARGPNVEPIVGVLTILGLVIYVWLGGHSNQGIVYVSAMLVGLTLAFLGFGLGAVLALRPLTRARVQARALRQYVQGGLHHLNKGNPKRARRLFERAFDKALGTPQADEIAKHLLDATAAEAEELRQKGFSNKADELVRAQAAHSRLARSVPSSALGPHAGTEPRAGRSPPAEAPTAELGAVTPPRLLRPEMIQIDRRTIGAPSPGTEEARVREVVRGLARKGRAREAFERLVESELAAPPELAEQAAKEYITEGFIRSADAIYEALGKRQGPDFYKAVAAEWSRENGGESPPEACIRLATILLELGDREGAARVACRGALSKRGADFDREQAAALALDLCAQLETEPPAELLESTGDFENAARLYEQDGKTEEALRAYRAAADRAMARGEAATKLIPLLSKIFLADPNGADKYLEPLAQHVLDSRASGSSSIRILAAYRRRRKGDARVLLRIFELYVDAGHQDEAYAELEQIAGISTSNPDGLLAAYRAFVERFGDHLKARASYVRALLKLGRIEDAATQVGVYLERSKGGQLNPAEAIALMVLLFDWGHEDPELRRSLGRLRLQQGEIDAGLAELERYVREGGRDPEVIATVRGHLAERLALPSGAPDPKGLLRLGRFLVDAGRPDAASVYLERVRGSKEDKAAAEKLLARVASAGDEGSETLSAPEGDAYDKTLDDSSDLEAMAVKEATEAALHAATQTELASADWTGPPNSQQKPHPALSPRTSGEFSMMPKHPLELEEEDEGLHLRSALLPRYRLLRRLGAGGMGEVHLAEDVELGRQVAIKVLRRSLATDLFLAKFREEARIVAQLAHPNIVAIYDLGHKANWSYIVMEYVDGADLATLIRDTEGFERHRLLGIIAGTAEAMAYAHGRGVIHRDLKPANILVGPGDFVKVTDFGIAKVLQPDNAQDTAFSAAGMQVGTVNYMAPEQIGGMAVDPRTDIYLLGTTLYVCLSGVFPYSGDAVAIQKLRQDPEPIGAHVADLSDVLQTLIMKCLCRRAAERPASMLDLAQALRAVPEARAP